MLIRVSMLLKLKCLCLLGSYSRFDVSHNNIAGLCVFVSPFFGGLAGILLLLIVLHKEAPNCHSNLDLYVLCTTGVLQQ